jgi:hypothetical protein
MPTQRDTMSVNNDLLKVLRSAGYGAGLGKAQQKQQAAAPPAAAPVRDLQAADAVLQGISLIIPR